MKKTITALALAAASSAACAHTGEGAHAHGFLAGFTHPFTGLDHLLAMLAVGAWSVRQPNAKWLPATFIGMLLIGMASGALGLSIPGLETGIALTVALMGVLLVAATRLPAAAGTAMVSVFAILHGNAHGHELPQAISAGGLLAASLLLVYGGNMLGRVSPALAVKASGAAIAATGVMLTATA
ncbi:MULTISPECIES: HupE/UreJ family protein [unclassified Duganella]|uniref:HupE/UreJ family protein n=1 Tax=unclassified Duganella TaxID=2636909 RepID=UPI000880D82D|nr:MULTISPECIES: HupE/UreJ family protein [unclassified Duganella]SDF61714.1 urease accessory protein [Duganella sp. OV458]SDI66759.1 urease accessory protein [Duganella sp. OV510]